MDLLTSQEAAAIWGITSRRVTTLCKEGRVHGAVCKGHTWLIPAKTAKPEEQKRGRKKQRDKV